MVSKSKALVLIAHGSRLEAANHEVRSLARALSEKTSLPVIPCFLECAEPDIPSGLDLALMQSPREILVFPYFLTQGRHVQVDIPAILREKARAYPETPIKLLDYFGTSPQIVEILAKIFES